jgi:alkaline phosphatase
MKRFMMFVFIITLISVLAIAQGYVKNVILLIGDGMGINQVLLSSYIEGRVLNMMKAPYTGYVITYSANSNVTDSAAAGTTLASGFKTNNGFIGVLPDGTPVPTIAEIAASKGINTGIVVTCRVTHATPGAFYGHTNDRNAELVLAEQLVESPLKVVFGGGWSYFLPDTKGGRRKDGKDLIELAKNKGFDYITTKTELLNYDGERVLGLFASSHMSAVTERKPEEPLLPEMTKKALEILSKDGKPFFLMVEGSQIDWECHGNDIFGVWKETIEFDDAVKVALDFAEKNPDTLVVVTADHETGGLGLSTGDYTFDIEKIRNYKKTADWIAANWDKKSPDELKKLVKEYFNVEFTDDEVEYVIAEAGKSRYGAGNAIGRLLSNKAQIGWTTFDHTGATVPVFAFGPGAENFTGILDNTEIPRIIGRLAGYPLTYPVHSVPLVGTH